MSRTALGRSPPGSPQGRPSLLPPDRGGFGSPTSPRSSFLGSFMRGRNRAASVTNAVAGAVRGRVGSPTVEAPNPLAEGHEVTRSVSTPPPRAAEPVNIPPVDPALRRTHRIRLVPVLESNRAFTFAPVLRELGVMHVPPGILPSIAAASVSDPGPLVNGHPPLLLLKVGRFTATIAAANAAAAASAAAASAAQGGGGSAGGGNDASAGNAAALVGPTPHPGGGGGGDILNPRAAFKSKVVSRSHAEIWCEPGGKFYIRDTASSSGTFLNHIRLSSPNVNSRPQLLKDGDVLQLGVDYQGGAEEMYRCVKMRVEIGREWQRGATEFNTKALKQLNALGGVGIGELPANSTPSSSRKKASVTDCCICLFSVTVCQSLFIAPCSHVFHYKCIRPLLQQHYPGFSCPLCRTFANLEEDVETEDAWEIASRRQSIISRRNSNHSLRLPRSSESGDGPSSSPPAPGPPDGHPSTGVAFGTSSASIDELLAASSGPASEDSHTPGELARQMTAVPGTSTPSRSGVVTPSTADVTEEDDVTPSHASAAPMTINTTTPGSISRSDTGVTAASLAQTPMNEVFLSTLVIGGGHGHGHGHGHGRDDSSLNSGGPSARLTPEIPEEPEEEAANTTARQGDDYILLADD